MARRPITSLQDLAEEFGMDHQLATELFRRIQRTVFEGNDVIVQEFGTFYHRQTKARPRVLNGTTYNVPAKESVGLKAPRFPGRTVAMRFNLNGAEFLGGEHIVFVRPNAPNPNTATINVDARIPFLGGTSGYVWRVEATVVVDPIFIDGEFDSFTHELNFRMECLSFEPENIFSTIRQIYFRNGNDRDGTEVMVGDVIEGSNSGGPLEVGGGGFFQQFQTTAIRRQEVIGYLVQANVDLPDALQ